jgi:GTP-binding protein
MITAEEGLTHQDKTLLRQIAKNYRPCLLLVNKWDLFDGRRDAGNVFLELLKHELKFMDYVPILTISAKTGRRIGEILPLVEELYEEFSRRITTSKVNALLEEIKTQYSFTIAGKRTESSTMPTQVEVAPPTFVVFVNVNPETIPRHIQKFFERKFREVLGFRRVPIKLIFRERS